MDIFSNIPGRGRQGAPVRTVVNRADHREFHIGETDPDSYDASSPHVGWPDIEGTLVLEGFVTDYEMYTDAKGKQKRRPQPFVMVAVGKLDSPGGPTTSSVGAIVTIDTVRKAMRGRSPELGVQLALGLLNRPQHVTGIILKKKQ